MYICMLCFEISKNSSHFEHSYKFESRMSDLYSDITDSFKECVLKVCVCVCVRVYMTVSV